jgi:cytochrome P450
MVTMADVGRPIPVSGFSEVAAAVAYNKDRLGFLLAMARQHGPVVELWPGMLLITGASEVDAVFRGSDRDFFFDRNFLLRKSDGRPGSDYLATMRRRRRAAMAGMTPDRLASHGQWLRGPASELAADWVRRRVVRDVAAELEQLTSLSMARFSFGGTGSDSVQTAAQGMLDALFPLFASPYVFPAYIRLVQPREWRVRRRLRALHSALDDALRSAVVTDEPSLAAVLRAEGITGRDAVQLLTSVHLAAHGVPAAAFAWAIAELGQDSDEQDRAAAAALDWDGWGPVPAEIGWVIDETLRLWPPSWLSDRVTGQSVRCGDWLLPARSRLLLPFWVIHRTADCYQDPDRFDSGRWSALRPPPGAYVPFGAGPHWCLGARLARLELTVMLAALLRTARFTVRGEVRPDARRTLTPAGFELEVRPR